MNKKEKILIASAMIGMGSAFGLSQSEILANTETPETQEGDDSILSMDVIENDSSKEQKGSDRVTITEPNSEDQIIDEEESVHEKQIENPVDSNEENNLISEEIKNEQEEKQEQETEIQGQEQPSTLLNGMVANKYYESGTMMTDQMISIGNQDYYADGTGELHPLQAVSYTMTRNNVQETLKGYIVPNGQVINVNSVNADFFIVQATNGYKGENKQFSAMADAVLANNKLLAMMHEARTGTKEDGHMEALHFYQTIKGYAGKGIPILKFMNTDLEAGPVWADEFMDTLYGLSGMKGMIWTSEEVMNKGDWEQAKKEQEVVTDITSLTMTKEEWKKKSETSLPSKVEEMYRMYNPYSGDHLYTTKLSERDGLVKLGWRYEGIGFHSEDEGKTTAVWRLFNPYTTIGTHHFTTNKAEYDELQKYGWIGEGIGWYGTLSTVPRNVTPSDNYLKKDKAYNKNRMNVTGVQKVNGSLYYFNPNNGGKYDKGTGLVSVAGTDRKVFVNADGKLFVGQKPIDGKYKWFDLNTGYMAVNQFVDIPASYNSGTAKTCYYDANGNMVYGHQNINGKYRWFDTGSGAMAKNTFMDIPGNYTGGNSKFVYCGADGAFKTGSFTINKATFTADNTGKIFASKLNGIPYYNQADGRWSYQVIGGRTIGSTGCVMMAATTIINYFNSTNYSPLTISRDCYNAGYFNRNVDGGTSDVWRYVANKYQLTYKNNLSYNDIVNELIHGKIVTGAVGFSRWCPYYGGVTHEIYLCGYNNGMVQVYDPLHNYQCGSFRLSDVWNVRSTAYVDNIDRGPFFALGK